MKIIINHAAQTKKTEELHRPVEEVTEMKDRMKEVAGFPMVHEKKVIVKEAGNVKEVVQKENLMT